MQPRGRSKHVQPPPRPFPVLLLTWEVLLGLQAPGAPGGAGSELGNSSSSFGDAISSAFLS